MVDYIIDHYTGLGWIRTPKGGSTTWDNNIIAANALTDVGFSDWRMPNINEIDSLTNWTQIVGNYAPISIPTSPITVFQTSTTVFNITTNYIRRVRGSYPNQAADPKSLVNAARGYMAVRNHYT